MLEQGVFNSCAKIKRLPDPRDCFSPKVFGGPCPFTAGTRQLAATIAFKCPFKSEFMWDGPSGRAII
jgi:hypothetical protein